MNKLTRNDILLIVGIVTSTIVALTLSIVKADLSIDNIMLWYVVALLVVMHLYDTPDDE